MHIWLVFMFIPGGWTKGEAHDLGDLPMQNPDLFEGDIIGIKSPEDRNAIPTEELRWPEGVIFYEIDSTLRFYTSQIRDVMDAYEKHTCLKFVERTEEEDYVKIFAGEGCYSHVGRSGGSQPMSLGAGCYWPGTIAHEIAHVIGFYHEQNRSDRDDYIDIHLENIKEGMEDQFRRFDPSENVIYNEFEYKSVMLYGETAFSKDEVSKTMTAKEEGVTLRKVSEKEGPTESDYYRINKLYDCIDYLDE